MLVQVFENRVEFPVDDSVRGIDLVPASLNSLVRHPLQLVWLRIVFQPGKVRPDCFEISRMDTDHHGGIPRDFMNGAPYHLAHEIWIGRHLALDHGTGHRHPEH